MRIVSGIVSKAGNVLEGNEYTVSSRASDRGRQGDKVNIYDIVFVTPFAAPPAITVTAEHRFRGNEDKMFGPYIDKIDPTERVRGFTVIMMKLENDDVDPSQQAYGAKDENRFHFIAVGE